MNRPSVWIGIVWLWCPVAALSSHVQAQENSLQPLEYYVGKWKCDFTIEATAGDNPPVVFAGHVDAQWILNDQFLEQTGSYTPSSGSQPMVIKTLLGWDKQTRQFRFDYFTSGGEVYRSYGNWDAARKTMTSTMTPNDAGETTIIVADFSVPDVESWTIQTRNRNGQVTARIAGRNQRQPAR